MIESGTRSRKTTRGIKPAKRAAEFSPGCSEAKPGVLGKAGFRARKAGGGNECNSAQLTAARFAG